jgi:hypothetical protein
VKRAVTVKNVNATENVAKDLKLKKQIFEDELAFLKEIGAEDEVVRLSTTSLRSGYYQITLRTARSPLIYFEATSKMYEEAIVGKLKLKGRNIREGLELFKRTGVKQKMIDDFHQCYRKAVMQFSNYYSKGIIPDEFKRASIPKDTNVDDDD